MRNALDQHDHVVQFYRTDAFLARMVAPYLAPNLRQGAPVLVVCTFEHLSAVAATLGAAGIDVVGLLTRGDFVWRDARVLLPLLRVGGVVSAVAFHREIGALVGSLCDRSQGKRVHVFGELVDLLWAEGNVADALRLEQMWHCLAGEYQFNLLCCYRLRSARYSGSSLRAVCGAHSHVLRSEKPLGIRLLADRTPRLPRLARPVTAGGALAHDRRSAGLREELEQYVFGLIMLGVALKSSVPTDFEAQMQSLILALDHSLTRSSQASSPVPPVPPPASPLAGEVQKYAAMTARLFDVSCEVRVARTFRDPERARRELLYSIVCEVVDRAARERGARDIEIALSRRGARQQLSIYHDGDSVVVSGTRDDGFRRLLNQARALGSEVELRPRVQGRLQLVCRW